MWSALISRARYCLRVCKRSVWPALVAGPLGLLGAATVLRDEFLSPEIAGRLKVLQMLQWLPDVAWYWWVMGLLFALVVLVLEGSFREYQGLTLQLSEANRRIEDHLPIKYIAKYSRETSFSAPKFAVIIKVKGQKLRRETSMTITGAVSWTMPPRHEAILALVRHEIDKDVILIETSISHQDNGFTRLSFLDVDDASGDVVYSICLKTLNKSFLKVNGNRPTWIEVEEHSSVHSSIEVGYQTLRLPQGTEAKTQP